jgi:hypothetical protein
MDPQDGTRIVKPEATKRKCQLSVPDVEGTERETLRLTLWIPPALPNSFLGEEMGDAPMTAVAK